MPEQKPEWDEFGEQCAGSRWFNREPTLVKSEVRVFEERWSCPCVGCDGEMKFNGMTWPTGDPGYHHTCSRCGFTAAIHGAKYPVHERVDDGERLLRTFGL